MGSWAKRLVAIALAGGLFGFSQPVWAGSIQAELDRNQGTLEDPFVLTVVVEGKADDPKPPQITGAQVQPAGRTSQTQFINGHFSSNVQYRFLIVPSAEGHYTIPPMKLKIDGKDQETPALAFDVLKVTATQKRQEAAFLEQTVSAKEIWEGETVQSVVKLHYRARIQLKGVPDTLGGSWQRVDSGKKPAEKEYRATVGGVAWNVYEVRTTLIPLKTGRVELAAARMDLAVEVPRKKRSTGTPFDDFFDEGVFGRGGEYVGLNVVSDPVVVTVKPLPTVGRPADFVGLVGRFSIKASLSAPTVNAGENVTLTVVVDGDGVIDRLGDMTPLLPVGFKSYSDKPVVERNVNPDGRMTGRKTFKYAIVPVEPGSFTIPEQTISVFDTAAGKYVTLKTEPIPLRVTGSAAVAASVGSIPAASDFAKIKKEAVKSLGTDLLPPKQLTRLTSRWLPSFVEWGVIGALLMVLPLMWLGLLLHDRWGGGQEGRERRRQERGAIKLLRSQLSALPGPMDAAFAGRALMAFRRFMAVKLGDGWLSYTAKEIRPKLLELSVSAETADAVVALVGQLESMEYGGGGAAGGVSDLTAPVLCDRLVNMAREIERSLS